MNTLPALSEHIPKVKLIANLPDKLLALRIR